MQSGFRDRGVASWRSPPLACGLLLLLVAADARLPSSSASTSLTRAQIAALAGIDQCGSYEKPGSGLRREDLVETIRWRGWLKAPITGSYVLHVAGAGDGVRVRIANGDVAFDRQGNSSATMLASERFYPISVEYSLAEYSRSNALPASLQIEWTPPHRGRENIPTRQLFPPLATVED